MGDTYSTGMENGHDPVGNTGFALIILVLFAVAAVAVALIIVLKRGCARSGGLK